MANVTADHGRKWTAMGSCRTYNREDKDRLWYTHNTDPRDPNVKEAQAICRACPVVEKCLELAMDLEHGLDSKQRYQIWGGLTPVQRAMLAQARRRAS